MLLLQCSAEPGHDLGVLAGHIGLLAGVRGEIVEFGLAGLLFFRLRAGVQVPSQRFPVAHANGLLAPVPR